MIPINSGVFCKFDKINDFYWIVKLFVKLGTLLNYHLKPFNIKLRLFFKWSASITRCLNYCNMPYF